MWETTRFCWDFNNNQPRHFPAGTYNAQIGQPLGKLELQTMDLLFKCWRVFSQVDLDDWTIEDQKFAAWVARDE